MNPSLNYIQIGKGKPLLLIHGLGGSWQSWNPIITSLAAHRKIIAIDLPGSGETPLTEEVSIEALCTSVTAFIMTHNLQGIDVAGSSMGARIALELARRGGIVGSVVALNPGGFWNRFEKMFFYITISVSLLLIKLLSPFMKDISRSPVGRKLLLSQFSYAPKNIAPETVMHEMRDFTKTSAIQKLLFNLAFGRTQQGMNRKQEHPITIVWGKNDYVCFKHQAKKAMKLFPKAHLIWLDKCGHFPHWDRPQDTIKIILEATSQEDNKMIDNVLPFHKQGSDVSTSFH